MKEVTKDEIIQATNELRDAYIEFVEIDDKESKLNIQKIKARKRLLLAREAITALKLH